MNLHSLTVLVLLCFPQDSASKEAGALIEKLRSGRVEERVQATERLKEMGKAALPELEKAREDKDPEVAKRVLHLIQVAALREKLSPNLLKFNPRLEDRLAEGGHAWTEVLL